MTEAKATTLELYFVSHGASPYILGEPRAYECDGQQGHVRFNGYFYVEDGPPLPEDMATDASGRPLRLRHSRRYSEHLPLKMHMMMRRRETDPYKVEVEDNVTKEYHNTVEEHMYFIEIYQRVKHLNTDQYGAVDIGTEEEPDVQNVCFFPTDVQTIYFRVLEEL
jgi:hypothetical protein